MKIESNKFINTRKIVEYLGNDVATKFRQIHASAWSDTASCYMLLVKLKCLDGKQKLRLLNTIGVSYKVSDKTVNVLKSYFKLFTILGEWKRVLLKKGCDYINKWKQKLFSLYHQKKGRCYKLLRVFTIKFFTRHE